MEKIFEMVLNTVKLLPIAVCFIVSLFIVIVLYPYIGPLKPSVIVTYVFFLTIVLLVLYSGFEYYRKKEKKLKLLTISGKKE